MPFARQIDAVRLKSANFEEVLERALVKARAHAIADPAVLTPEALDASFFAIRENAPYESANSYGEHVGRAEIEAIILVEERPAWFIENDEIVIGQSFDDGSADDLIDESKPRLDALARHVGRVDLVNGSRPFAGTGWLIDENVVVTNAHVAHAFMRQDWLGNWQLAHNDHGDELRVELNARRQRIQDRIPRRELEVERILYVAGHNEPDIAFLRVRNSEGWTPLTLRTGPVGLDDPIAAIGYPARDAGRNDAAIMDRIFDRTYNVKRFSPGYVTQVPDGDWNLLTDYTTLGNSSGSSVVHVESGDVIGLHYAGRFGVTNRAVDAATVVAALRAATSRAFVQGAALPREASDVESFEGRKGYDPAFLGSGDLRVDLPGLGPYEDDLAPVAGVNDNVLRYTHFSVLQSRSRRLPLLTAVNIDGAKAYRLKRKGKWRLDGRIDDDHQIGNELYRRNPLDRGHLVRRKDPGWGRTKAEAQQGELDTFHYTNAAPQHEGLNQKDWVQLEDYILEAATTRGLKVSVLTGPVYRADDPTLRRQPGAEDIKIPRSFWKLAAMVREDTGDLSVTAYVLDQGELIRHMTEAAFVFGEFRVYQVRVASLRQTTGLDFSGLARFDPLNDRPEETFGRAAFQIDGPESLIL